MLSLSLVDSHIFFECEMKIPYKESNSESENMWSRKMLIYSHFTDRFPAYFLSAK